MRYFRLGILSWLVAGLGLGVAWSPGVVTTARAAEMQRVMVPAYFYPGSIWSQAISGAAGVSVLIMNPDSGPGDAVNADYQSVLREARGAGVGIAGYVHTSYGARPLEAVTREIERYRQWYGVTDVFLDEAATDLVRLPYYRQLADVIRSNGGRVTLNHGAVPDEQYLAVADVVVTYEGTYATYASASFPEWMRRYPSTRFSHLVYQTSAAEMTAALTLAYERNVGLVYVTDDGGVNPWDTLPSYWSKELALLASVKPDTTTPVPTTVVPEQTVTPLQTTTPIQTTVVPEQMVVSYPLQPTSAPASTTVSTTSQLTILPVLTITPPKTTLTPVKKKVRKRVLRPRRVSVERMLRR